MKKDVVVYCKNMKEFWLEVFSVLYGNGKEEAVVGAKISEREENGL